MIATLRHFLLTILTTIVLVSCEGISGGSGFILTTKNRAPIDSAQIILLLNNTSVDTVYSGKNGGFQIGHLVGCVPKCPESRLIISKNGYQSVDFNVNKEYEKNPRFQRDSVKIFLTRTTN